MCAAWPARSPPTSSRHEDPRKGVVVGYDTRFGSRSFARAAAEVLAAAGIPVRFSNDYMPTPALSYAVRSWAPPAA